MTVRINKTFSPPLKMSGGGPQGSILGVMIFNVSIDDIEESAPGFLQDTDDDIHVGDFFDTVDRSYLRDVEAGLDPTGSLLPSVQASDILDSWESLSKTGVTDVDVEPDPALSLPDPRFGRNISVSKATKSQHLFRLIECNAAFRGMQINNGETQMLTISAATSYDAESYLNTSDDSRIDCGPSMRVLGFHFNRQPNVSLTKSF